MSFADRILQQQIERKARLDAARVAASALMDEEFREFFAELYAKLARSLGEPEHTFNIHSISDATTVHVGLQHAEVFPPAMEKTASIDVQSTARDHGEPPDQEGPSEPAHLRRDSTKKIDRAEVFVWDNASVRKGVTTRQVAKELGVDVATAGNILRQVHATRGTIQFSRRFREWSRVTQPKGNWKEPKITLREAIKKALANDKRLGTGAIFHVVKEKIRADASYQSVAAEIMRMRKRGLLVLSGWGGRGVLYALPPVTPKEPLSGYAQESDATARVLLNGGVYTPDVH
jgi:hypothetical protein